MDPILLLILTFSTFEKEAGFIRQNLTVIDFIGYAVEQCTPGALKK